MPALVDIAVLRVANWICNTAASAHKFRPHGEVWPLLNLWRIMALLTLFTWFSRPERIICIINFLVKSFLAGYAFRLSSLTSTLTPSASFAALFCLHWPLKLVCLGMCSRANVWLHWFYGLDSFISRFIAFREFWIKIFIQARRSDLAWSFSDATRRRILSWPTCLTNIHVALSDLIMVSWTRNAFALVSIWYATGAHLAFLVHGLSANHLNIIDFSF